MNNLINASTYGHRLAASHEQSHSRPESQFQPGDFRDPKSTEAGQNRKVPSKAASVGSLSSVEGTRNACKNYDSEDDDDGSVNLRKSFG